MIIGLLRVKNEARWIERVLASILPVCDRVLVFDDHSEDGTPFLCAGFPRVSVFNSPFAGLNEARDKDYLLSKVWEVAGVGDWCLMVDGDEALHSEDIANLIAATQGEAISYSAHIVYLWDRENQVRVDRWYKEFRRPSLFRLTSRDLSFLKTDAGGNFHCSSVPQQLLRQTVPAPIRLLHYGYLHREDRIRKYGWYNQKDPGNLFEDCYRHMVIGDLPELPVSSSLRWAGPLQLEALR